MLFQVHFLGCACDVLPTYLPSTNFWCSEILLFHLLIGPQLSEYLYLFIRMLSFLFIVLSYKHHPHGDLVPTKLC